MKKTVLYDLLVTLTIVLALLLTACSSVTPTPTLHVTPVATATPPPPTIAPTFTPIPPTFTPLPTFTYASTATPQPPTAIPTPDPTFYLLNFTFADALHGWALGYKQCASSSNIYCIVMRTSKDGGKTWQDSPAPKVEFPSLEAAYKAYGYILFANPKDGWASVGTNLYFTHDSGLTWQQESSSDTILDILPIGNSIWRTIRNCTNQDIKPLCSYDIYNSVDGGHSWQLLPSHPLNVGKDEKPVLVRGTTQDAYIMAATNPNAPRPQVVLKATHNGGKSWEEVTFPYCFFAPDFTLLAAVGANGLRVVCHGTPATVMLPKALFSSKDGGKTWSITSSVRWGSSPDNALGDIPLSGLATYMVFTSPTRGYMIFGRNTLHVTNDGGKTWAATSLANKDYGGGAGGEGNLIFVDTQHGWVSFMDKNFRTTDGGATWEEFPIK